MPVCAGVHTHVAQNTLCMNIGLFIHAAANLMQICNLTMAGCAQVGTNVSCWRILPGLKFPSQTAKANEFQE